MPGRLEGWRGRSSRREMASTMKGDDEQDEAPAPAARTALRLPGWLSGNSSATIELMVLPGPNRLVEMRSVFPITKVTAMVSPSARPRPSMMPPTTEARVYGSTTERITSQVVQPRP